jgi:hypothetical protein
LEDMPIAIDCCWRKAIESRQCLAWWDFCLNWQEKPWSYYSWPSRQFNFDGFRQCYSIHENSKWQRILPKSNLAIVHEFGEQAIVQ